RIPTAKAMHSRAEQAVPKYLMQRARTTDSCYENLFSTEKFLFLCGKWLIVAFVKCAPSLPRLPGESTGTLSAQPGIPIPFDLLRSLDIEKAAARGNCD